jgi:hypothetical protein
MLTNQFNGIGLYRSISFLCFALAMGTAVAAQEQTEESEKFKKWLDCASFSFLYSIRTTDTDFTAKVIFHGRPMPDVAVVLQRKESPIEKSPTQELATENSQTGESQTEEPATQELPSDKSQIKDSSTRESPTEVESIAFFRGKTDSDGVVKFSGISRGKYSIRVEESLGPAFSEVDVNPDADAFDEVVLEWPVIQHVVKNVRGTVVSMEQAIPLEQVGVELLDIRSSHVIADALTGVNGQYEIYGVSDGPYILRFIPRGSHGHTDIGVELSGQGVKELPVMQLEETDCGITLAPAKAPVDKPVSLQ